MARADKPLPREHVELSRGGPSQDQQFDLTRRSSSVLAFFLGAPRDRRRLRDLYYVPDERGGDAMEVLRDERPATDDDATERVKPRVVVDGGGEVEDVEKEFWG